MVAPIETGILQRLLDRPGSELPPEVARLVLSWRFDETDQQRLTELSSKARAGSLLLEEARQLDWYLLIGDFLTILQSKARPTLQKGSSAA